MSNFHHDQISYYSLDVESQPLQVHATTYFGSTHIILEPLSCMEVLRPINRPLEHSRHNCGNTITGQFTNGPIAMTIKI
jgi:hypothetical protein